MVLLFSCELKVSATLCYFNIGRKEFLISWVLETTSFIKQLMLDMSFL